MNAFARHPSLFDATLDVGRDDYYDHPGPWFDLRDSLWLDRLDAPPASLTVVLAGQGQGTVLSDDGSIACPPRCSTELDAGYPLTLTVDSAPGFTLLGWSGACSGSEACHLNADGAMTLTARIEPAVQPLQLAVAGRGRIVSSAGSCRRRCSVRAETGAAVTFRARPAAGWKFVRWTSGCSGSRPRCTLTIDQSVTVAARFRRTTA
jgi:hypothetical protein